MVCPSHTRQSIDQRLLISFPPASGWRHAWVYGPCCRDILSIRLHVRGLEKERAFGVHTRRLLYNSRPCSSSGSVLWKHVVIPPDVCVCAEWLIPPGVRFGRLCAACIVHRDTCVGYFWMSLQEPLFEIIKQPCGDVAARYTRSSEGCDIMWYPFSSCPTRAEDRSPRVSTPLLARTQAQAESTRRESSSNGRHKQVCAKKVDTREKGTG